MTTQAVRRVYTPEFKGEAVALHRGGKALAEVADTLDVPVALVKTWVLQAEMNDPVVPAPVATPQPPISPPPTPLPVHRCVVCGRGPALKVTLRAVTGNVIAFRMRHVDGAFCHDCGISMARRTLNRTLITGWWGIFFAGIATLFATITNAVALGRFKRLAAAMGEPKAEPLKHGTSLFQRAGIYIAIVVNVAPFVLGFAVGAFPTADRFNTKCVAFAPNRIVAKPSCDDAHDGRVVAVVSNKVFCPDMADVTMRLKADAKKLLCIDLDQ